MNEILTINYESENPTVSARELHEKLHIGTKFTTWFERMKEYGFSEGKEFFPKYQFWCFGNCFHPPAYAEDANGC